MSRNWLLYLDDIVVRDFIAHRYFALDAQIIWDAAVNRIPEILTAARTLLARFDTGSSAP